MAAYERAKTELGAAPAATATATEKNKYNSALATLDAKAATIRKLARDIAQDVVKGMHGYTSGLRSQTKRVSVGRRYGVVPRPNIRAVSGELDDATDVLGQAKDYLGTVRSMVDSDADLSAGSVSYIDAAVKRVEGMDRLVGKASTRHSQTVETRESKETDKKWEKRMKKIEKAAKSGWI